MTFGVGQGSNPGSSVNFLEVGEGSDFRFPFRDASVTSCKNRTRGSVSIYRCSVFR